MDLEKCILRAQLTREFVNVDGYAKIVPKWDEEALQGCPICGGLKFIENINPQGYRVISPCPGDYALRRIELFNQACIPARYKDARFESFNTKVCRSGAADIARFIEEIKNFKKGDLGRLFEGDSGTGKTHLMCAAIRYLTLELGVACRYVDFSILISDIRAAYGASENGFEWEFLRPIVFVPVLFFDELGKGRKNANEFELRIVDEIVNRRYENPDLTTFFASNYRDRETSGYRFYCANGYNVQASSPMESEKWKKFAVHRWSEENRRKTAEEVRFRGVEDFEAYVRDLMGRDHIEDRISERTASRIVAMAIPTFIQAPDYRRSIQ